MPYSDSACTSLTNPTYWENAEVNVKKDKQSNKVKRSARTLPKKVDWVKQFMVTEYTISAVVYQMNCVILVLKHNITSIKSRLFYLLFWRVLHQQVAPKHLDRYQLRQAMHKRNNLFPMCFYFPPGYKPQRTFKTPPVFDDSYSQYNSSWISSDRRSCSMRY